MFSSLESLVALIGDTSQNTGGLLPFSLIKAALQPCCVNCSHPSAHAQSQRYTRKNGKKKTKNSRIHGNTQLPQPVGGQSACLVVPAVVSDLETNKYSQVTAKKSACVSVTGAGIWVLCSILQVCVHWKQEQHHLKLLNATNLTKFRNEKRLNVVIIVYGSEKTILIIIIVEMVH